MRRLPLVNRAYHAVFRMGMATGGSEVRARYRGVVPAGPAWDRTIMPSVSAGYYEEFEVGVFERLAAASTSILDVGANIGVYACTGAARLPPDGSLVAFEPVPENLGYLRRNVAANGLGDRVIVEPVAVGEAPGELTLHLSNEQSGKHSAPRRTPGTPWTPVTVPMTSIDSYLAGGAAVRPEIIKIDIEGFEGFALRGATETLAARPTLLFELHPELQANCGCDSGELLDLIFDRYRWVFLIDELAGRLRPCTRVDLGEPGAVGLYRCNVVAIGRRDHLDAVGQWHDLN